MRALIALMLALSLSPGCAARRGLGDDTTQNRDTLADTVWKINVPGGDPPVAYVQLRADGRFGYNYTAPQDFTYDEGDTWKVDRGVLVISWTDGYSVESYPLMGGTTKFFGGKTSKSFEGEHACTIQKVQ